MGLICIVPRPHLLGRALIWPGYFGARSFGHFLDYTLRVWQSLLDLFLLLGKFHWFPYLRLSYFFNLPLDFEFHGKSYVAMGALATESRLRLHLVPPTLRIILHGG